MVHEGNRGRLHVRVGLLPDVLALVIEEEVLSLESARTFGVWFGGEGATK